MARSDGAKKGRVFTVELESKAALKSASLGNGAHEGVLIEGTLGVLTKAGFLDGVVLEVLGTRGVLRVDLLSEELRGSPHRMPVNEGGDRT